MQCSPQHLHSKPVMHKQFDTRQHVRTAGAWRGLDRQALEGCLGVVALALGVVMAGTGHLPTLKLLRGGSPFLVTSSLPLLAPITPPPPCKTPNCLPVFWHPVALSSSLLCSSASYLLLLSVPSQSHLSPCHVSCLRDLCCLLWLPCTHLAMEPYPPAPHILSASSLAVRASGTFSANLTKSAHIALTVDSPDESQKQIEFEQLSDLSLLCSLLLLLLNRCYYHCFCGYYYCYYCCCCKLK